MKSEGLVVQTCCIMGVCSDDRATKERNWFGVKDETQAVCVAKGDAPKQDRTTDLPLTKRVLYH